MGDISKRDFYEDFKKINNIAQFQQWLLKVVQEAFDHIRDRNESRNAYIIMKVKEYAAGNLGTDLSLDTVAGKVHFSAAYLSKVFKDETGINFTDFVTQQRLEKAKTLILTTDFSIEEITLKIGFNSSGYFIKKFKETYGATPKNFKMNTRINL